MGLSYAKLLLKNPRKPDLQPVEVNAMADCGAVHLCIPAHVQLQLELEEADRQEVTLADGSRKVVPYVGPVELRFSIPDPWSRQLFMALCRRYDLTCRRCCRR